jgi:GNAT superfamily N-acetyltransferase
MKLNVRQATVEDAVGIARVIVDGWHSTYAGIIPEDFLASMKYSEHAKGTRQLLSRLGSDSRALIAESDGKIVGALIVTPPAYPVGDYESEIVSFYVLPSHQRKGVGAALLLACAKWLLETGRKDVFIWILGVSPFRSLGERFGAELLADQREEHIGESKLPLVAYGWRDLKSLVELLTQSNRSSS